MIYNLDTRTYLAEHPVTALGWWMRLRGMIGRRFVRGEFDAMVFPRCTCVHSLGMGIPIDLVFLDRDSVVVGLRRNYPPWALLPRGCRKAVTTIELPAGTIQRTGTELNHKINLNSILTPEAIEKLNPGAILNAEILPRNAAERNGLN